MSKQTNPFQQLIAMIMGLIDDAVIEESKEFPDPDTGSPREVDVYVLIRGTVNGQDVRIAVECVDRSKKMDAPWVEMIYGKHCRLQVADIVLLVSSKGFYRPAELKARRWGYKTITPSISPMKLSRTLGLAGGHRMSLKVATLKFVNLTLNVSPAGQLYDDGPFRRADDSELVTFDDYKTKIATDELGGPVAFMSAAAGETVHTTEVTDPVHDGEPLYVRLLLADGQLVLGRVNSVQLKFEVSSTDRADFDQTELVDFNGVQIGTGTSTLDGRPARMVVTEGEDGSWKAAAQGVYEVKPPDDEG